jgi:hypothetical protein
MNDIISLLAGGALSATNYVEQLERILLNTAEGYGRYHQ